MVARYRLLVDTHCWLWITSKPDRFSAAAQMALSDARVELLVSAVVSWEIAIKSHLGKLDLPEAPAPYMKARLERHGATPIGIEHSHVLGVADLPHHHRDPFDRLLVAQARALSVPLLTADRAMGAYDVEIFWADAAVQGSGPRPYMIHEPGPDSPPYGD